jgi:hypothetical protein
LTVRARHRVVLLALGLLSFVCTAEGKAPTTITVVPRSESGVFRDTTLVYLDGPIDDDAPARLSAALVGIAGKTAIWLNSPGGNLFAGMELGRIIRKHGASTHIIDSRTLLPGECYSACAMAFLGGVLRFNDNGARYGVHRASLSVPSPTGNVDLGEHLSAAIRTYIREMDVDVRLLDLWRRAGPDEMYVLNRQEAKDLRVVHDGRQPPTWRIVTTPRGPLLQGRQTAAEGTGTVSFSCDDQQTVLGSVYEPAGKGESTAAGRWIHLLTIDRYDERPLKELGVSLEDGVVRGRFTVPPDVVRLAMSAKQIGHRMRPSDSRSSAFGYSVDIDARAVSTVKKFLGNCLRRQAKHLLPS